jgi:competence protein ComEA
METHKYSEVFSKLLDEVKAADDNKARLFILLKRPLVIITVCLLAILLLQWYKSTSRQTSPLTVNTNQVSAQIPNDSSRYIYVDLSGSVVEPKVHRVPENTRLFEILSASGGLNELADRPYFYRNYNLAMILNDQDKIYVPSINEVVSGVYLENNKLVSAYTQGTTQSKQSASEPTGKISINTASQALLETLKGVGNITASRIIAGRPYKTIDELVDKDILKSALFDSIKDQLDL